MPINEYICPRCGVFEVMTTKISDVTEHEKCKCGHKAPRVISKSNFKLTWVSEARDERAGRVRDA